MMPEILTESFCERCGTRYTFEATAPAKVKKLGKFKTLSKGLKNYVLSDENSLDEAMAAARSDEERELTSQQLEAFQETFNFCMTCRQYTCANCWNAAEGACLTCAPLNGHATAAPTFLLDLAPLVPAEPPQVVTSAWPTSDLSRRAAEAASAKAAAEASSTNGATNGTELADRLALFAAPASAAAEPIEPPPVTLPEAAAAPVELAAERPSAWPIAAEQAASPDFAIETVAEPDSVAIDAEPVIEVISVAPEPASPEVMDWPTMEAEVEVEVEASAEAEPVAAGDVEILVPAEPATADAAPAPDLIEMVPSETVVTSIDTYAFESDIAPAVAELPADIDSRAAAAARRTSDLLARLRPPAGTRPARVTVEAAVDAEPAAEEVAVAQQAVADTSPIEPIVASAQIPVEGPVADIAAEAVSPSEQPTAAPVEVAAADTAVPDYPDVEPAREDPDAVEAWRDEPVAALPPELLAIIGPPIEVAPDPGLEVAAEAATEPMEAAAEVAEPAEPAQFAAAVLAELDEPAATRVVPEPEAVRADIVEQPTWRIVAPDLSAPDTNGHTPLPEPAQPTIAARTPTPPPVPVEPQWPNRPAAVEPDLDPGFLLSRRTADSPEGLWAASARGVVAQPAGAPILAVQACSSCGLSLSATARFCRRCGSRQGA